MFKSSVAIASFIVVVSVIAVVSGFSPERRLVGRGGDHGEGHRIADECVGLVLFILITVLQNILQWRTQAVWSDWAIFKDRDVKISGKSSPPPEISGDFWLLWKHHFLSKHLCGYFLVNVEGNWASLKSNIWSHWTQDMTDNSESKKTTIG